MTQSDSPSSPYQRPTVDAVRQVLKEWQRGDAAISPFDDLLLLQPVLQQGPISVRAATNQTLQTGLDLLAAENPDGHRILELRFIESRAANQVATMMSMAEGTVWRKQNEATQRLTDILQSLEADARAQRLEHFAARMETASYTRLFGRESNLLALEEQFNRAGPPWQIAIEGIGGIGKTSLADMLTRRLLGDARWQDFAWVTARQETFNSGGAIKQIKQPAITSEALIEELVQQLLGDDVERAHLVYPQKLALLQERLRARPHLIVIDNLESLRDQEQLLDSLREFANPTKFLITTRLSHFHAAGIFHFSVPELDRQDSLALIRQEALVGNAPGIAQASDDDLMPIVDTVGGNPLALRLVVGQLHTHALGRVLDDLHNTHGRRAAEIYTYIYRRSWQDLDEMSRRVLLLMPLVVDSGGDYDYLAEMGAMAGLSPAQIDDGLGELVRRNLVDSRGDLHRRRYSIHGLTRTFLQQEVLGWQDDD